MFNKIVDAKVWIKNISAKKICGFLVSVKGLLISIECKPLYSSLFTTLKNL